jgi:NO-binding membrane sensor protein with MHYT domain
MPDTSYKYLLIALPVLPLIFVCFTIIRFVTDADEMLRKIYMEAMAFSGIATGFTCFSSLFIHDSGGPKLPLEYGFYLMWIYYFIGLFFSWRRYR